MPQANDPYRLKRPSNFKTEEQKLIQIRDDSARPPVSVGTDNFSSIILGAASLQPSKSELSTPKGLSLGGLFILFFLFLPVAALVIIVVKGLLRS